MIVFDSALKNFSAIQILFDVEINETLQLAKYERFLNLEDRIPNIKNYLKGPTQLEESSTPPKASSITSPPTFFLSWY